MSVLFSCQDSRVPKQMGDSGPDKAILIVIIPIIKTYLGLLCQLEVSSQLFFPVVQF